jgi:uncharacterized protein (TIRG00374 family)
LLPTGSGDVARLIILQRSKGISVVESAPPVILERLSDILLLLFLSLFFAIDLMKHNISLLIPLISILGLIGILFIRPILIEYPLKLCKFIGNHWMLRIFNKITQKFVKFKDALQIYGKSHDIAFYNIFITAIVWIIFETLSHYFLLEAFAIYISYLDLLGIVAISWILGTMSMLPGGLGARETVYALTLTKFGVKFGVGLSIALVYRILVYILFATLALISAWKLVKKRG